MTVKFTYYLNETTKETLVKIKSDDLSTTLYLSAPSGESDELFNLQKDLRSLPSFIRKIKELDLPLIIEEEEIVVKDT
jgi:hypothetical protein